MNFIQTPTASLPTLPDWAEPDLTPLATPSRTAAALAQAHASLHGNISAHNARVRTHMSNLSAFADAVRGVDHTHAAAFRGQ